MLNADRSKSCAPQENGQSLLSGAVKMAEQWVPPKRKDAEGLSAVWSKSLTNMVWKVS